MEPVCRRPSRRSRSARAPGLLLRRVSVEGRSSAELLGTGDVVRPWRDGCDAEAPPSHSLARAPDHSPCVLDDHAVERMADYPEIMRGLLERSLDRSRRLAVNMAIVHHPRVDIRLQMLFWHLADRWGRVRNGQTILPLRSRTRHRGPDHGQHPTVSTASVTWRAAKSSALRQMDGCFSPGRRKHGLGSDEPMADIPGRRSTRPDRGKDRGLGQTH